MLYSGGFGWQIDGCKILIPYSTHRAIHPSIESFSFADGALAQAKVSFHQPCNLASHYSVLLRSTYRFFVLSICTSHVVVQLV